MAARLAEARVLARCVTLKVKRKKDGAPEPSKFMGHGCYPLLPPFHTLLHKNRVLARC